MDYTITRSPSLPSTLLLPQTIIPPFAKHPHSNSKTLPLGQKPHHYLVLPSYFKPIPIHLLWVRHPHSYFARNPIITRYSLLHRNNFFIEQYSIYSESNSISAMHTLMHLSMSIPTSPNRGQVGELTTGNGNSPTSGCQFSPDSYLGELTLDVNSPTLWYQFCVNSPTCPLLGEVGIDIDRCITPKYTANNIDTNVTAPSLTNDVYSMMTASRHHRV